jgi:uncharacterized protein YkwD
MGGAAIPAAADTPTPRPLPSIEISLPGITLSVRPPVPPPASVDALEATLLTKLNAERAAGGLAALALQPWASSVARAHSQEMAGARDIWHNHTGYLDIARQAIGAYLTGENVAEAGTLDETDSLLMNSPPHRANILYPAFNSVGIGVALDAVGYVYVTQDFVTIRPAPPAVVASQTKGTPVRASPAAPAVAGAPRVAAATVPARLPAIAKPLPAVRASTASHRRRPRRARCGPERTRRRNVSSRPSDHPQSTNPVPEGSQPPTRGMLTTARNYLTGAGLRPEPGPFVGGSTPGWGQLETIPTAHMPNDPADR